MIIENITSMSARITFKLTSHCKYLQSKDISFHEKPLDIGPVKARQIFIEHLFAISRILLSLLMQMLQSDWLNIKLKLPSDV